MQPLDSSVDLSIVIVTHRTREQVRDCLVSLYRDGGLNGLCNPQVIVVDNASPDGTPEMVRSEFPDAELIASQENVGFARGNNLGIARAVGRNVLLLNPDTVVPENALTDCLRWLETQPDTVGAMTCRVHLRDGSLQPECTRRLPSLWTETCRAFLLDRMFPRSDRFNPEYLVRWNKTDARSVPNILGAFMFLRRPVLEIVGGMDPDFFLMYEDTDLCKRIWDAGYSVWYWPGAHILHLKGQFTSQEPIITFANAQLSVLLYFRKHFPRRVGLLRWIMRRGMDLKILLLVLNALRKPRDEYTRNHLAMARAARNTLKTGKPIRYGEWA